MCGRYGLTRPPWGLAKRLGASVCKDREFTPQFNIAPTQPVLGITNDRARTLVALRWGFVPYWAKSPADVKLSTFNARVETVATAPTYRNATAKRRCILLADGFYEWRKNGDGTKTPVWIHRQDDEPFAFAGLWDVWRSPDQQIVSCTIITTAANAFMAGTHSRMPVVVDDERARAWLASEPLTAREALDILVPSESSETWAMHPVSPRVGNVRNDDAGLIEPV